MTVPKTASKTALFLQCPRPFSEDTETEHDEPGEPALYGTRWHKETARVLFTVQERGWFKKVWAQEEIEDEELRKNVKAAADSLRAWCEPEGNPWGLSFKVVEVETSRALDLTKSSDGTIKVKLDDPDGLHEYVDEADFYLAPNYLAGTADVVLEAESATGIFRVVLDHKTGEDYANEYVEPSKLPQLQALAEMWDADAVAVLHAPRGAPVQIYAEMTQRNVSRFRHELWRAYRLVDSGFMRPGPECKFCPARTSCPAKQGELIASTAALAKQAVGPVDLTQAADPGKFHQFLSQLTALEKQARSQLREMVRSGEVIERPDGKTLEIQMVTVERLSKKSIIEAFGAEKGGEVLRMLRNAGALKDSEEERLVAK